MDERDRWLEREKERDREIERLNSVLLLLILHIYIYIYIYMSPDDGLVEPKRVLNSFEELCIMRAAANCCKKKIIFASNKVFIWWWPWVQAWFRGRSTITTNPGHPSSISQYYPTLLDGVWTVWMPYPFRCSYSLVLDLFFIYSLFSARESPSLVKNVEVDFEIKLQEEICLLTSRS